MVVEVDRARFAELKAEGFCCTQIVMQLGLEAAGRDSNPEMIQALSALCGGVRTGLVCGILTGAACLISLLQPENDSELIADLVAWFRDEYGEVDCEAILEGDELNKTIKCPKMILETTQKTLEILEESGVEFDGA